MAAACAVGALAAVFSVQQGEHGPLVVYKLQVKPEVARAAPPAPPTPPTGAAVLIIPSRAPRVLGTVVLPAGRAAAPPLPVPLAPALIVTAAPAAGGVVTLQQVSDDLTWRRETAGKLPQAPFAPRF